MSNKYGIFVKYTYDELADEENIRPELSGIDINTVFEYEPTNNEVEQAFEGFMTTDGIVELIKMFKQEGYMNELEYLEELGFDVHGEDEYIEAFVVNNYDKLKTEFKDSLIEYFEDDFSELMKDMCFDKAQKEFNDMLDDWGESDTLSGYVM